MPLHVEPLETRLLWSAALSGSFAAHLPAALSPANSNHVAVRIINVGDQPAGGQVSVNLYASPSPAPGPSQTLLATTQRAIHLRPGRGSNVPLRFKTPPGLLDGNYFLLARINGNTGTRSDQTIASPHTIAIRQPFIDLTGRFSTFPVGAVDVNNSGGDLLGVRVVNQGNVPAVGALAVSFYASTDATPDSSDTLIGVAARNVRIRAGGSQQFFAPITFPSGFTVGNYYVFAQVDSAQAFAESDEGNNTVVAPRQLIAANVPPPTLVDQRERQHHHHHDEAVVVESGGFIGGAFFVGDVTDSGDFSGDPFAPDNSTPTDSGGMDQPPPDSAPPDDSSPPDSSSGGWDTGSSAGSDF